MLKSKVNQHNIYECPKKFISNTRHDLFRCGPNNRVTPTTDISGSSGKNWESLHIRNEQLTCDSGEGTSMRDSGEGTSMPLRCSEITSLTRNLSNQFQSAALGIFSKTLLLFLIYIFYF